MVIKRDAHQANARAWNQAAEAYGRSVDKTLDLIRTGRNSMCAAEAPFLANLKDWCHRAIHLQCAGGEDTLSLLNLGAKEVVGIDISQKMIEVAQQTSNRLAANARWVNCDVLDTPDALNGTADLVYTGRGAINWIHDLQAWAQTVMRLLKPQGLFYMFEGHPFTYVFAPQASSLLVDPDFEGYFSRKIYKTSGWTPEYIGDLGLASEQMSEKQEIAWPVSEVITALLSQGLVLERFQEHSEAYWTEFPNLPDTERQKIPNTYSLAMRRR